MPNESINMDKQEFISLDEAAKMAKKGKSTIRRWRRDGLLTAHRVDKQKTNSPILIDKNELLMYLGSTSISTQEHDRLSTTQKSVSIDTLKKEIDTLKNKLEASKIREDLYLSKLNQAYLSTEKKDSQIDSLTALLNKIQNDLRLAHEQIGELTSKQEELQAGATLYKAECERGFLGRLERVFKKAKPIPPKELPNEPAD
jgi:ribosomal protein L25 (general stress protein Ctc)